MKEELIAKERILASVRNALIEKSDNPFPNIDSESSVFHDAAAPLDINFVEKFIDQGGKFVFCDGVQETIAGIKSVAQQENWDKIYCNEPSIQKILSLSELPFSSDDDALLIAKVGFTSCEHLISRTGSLMLSSGTGYSRRLFASVDTHVVVATTNQITPDLKTALQLMKEKYGQKFPSMFHIITGTSKIKDIDGATTAGLGPKQLYLFLIDAAAANH